MNRLREETGSDPTRARGVKLLRSTGARENVPEMKQRVWVAVLRSRRLAHRSWSPRPGLLLRRRPAFLAGLLLLSAATAGAMIGRRVVEQRAASLSRPVETASQSTHHAANRPVQLALAPTPAAYVRSASALTRSEVRGQALRTKERATVSRRVPIASVGDRSQGNQMLLDAMVALRRDRDSQRAGELLERFLNEFPHGALREEAIALSVEAALARNDGGARDRWAHAYLQAYPSGRFRDFVEGSLAAQ